MSKPHEVDAMLRDMYDYDEGNCSDFTAKCLLLKAVVGEPRYDTIATANPRYLDVDRTDERHIDELDRRMLEWINSIPALVRWSVEARYGLWTGTMLPDDEDSIGEQLGLSSTLVANLYREGLRILAKPENFRILELKEPAQD